jgi:hypothetical protein
MRAASDMRAWALVAAVAAVVAATTGAEARRLPAPPAPVQDPPPAHIFHPNVQPMDPKYFGHSSFNAWGLEDEAPPAVPPPVDLGADGLPLTTVNLVEYTLEHGNASGDRAARELQATCTPSTSNGDWSGLAPDMTFCGACSRPRCRTTTWLTRSSSLGRLLALDLTSCVFCGARGPVSSAYNNY